MQHLKFRFLFCHFLIYWSLVIGHLSFAAQAAEKAFPVCPAFGKVDQQNPLTVPAKDGYYIVFEDKRSGKTGLYAQKIDEEGKILWDKNAVPLSNQKSNQTAAQAISAEDGGLIVAWQDDRGADSDIYAQKISPAGKVEWEAGGAEVSVFEKNQAFPQLAGDGANGALIVWHDLRNNIENIYAQRIGQSGEKLFAKNGLPIAALPNTEWFPKIASDRQGGAYLAWSDRRAGNFDVYAQRIDPNGKFIWKANGIPAAATLDSEENPEIACLADGSLLVAYAVKNQGVFFQCLDGQGKLKFSGSIKSPSPASLAIASGSENDFLAVWSDNYAGDPDIYMQRIGAGGNFLWGESEHPLVKIRGAQSNPRLSGNSDWVAVWADRRSGRPELFAQKISRDGTLLWGENGKKIAATQAEPQNVSLCVNSAGETVIGFDDKKAGSYDIYAQKIDPPGQLKWGAEAVLVNSSGGRAVQKNVKVIRGQKQEYIFALEDYRSGYANIYLQKVNSAGAALWTASGVPASRQSSDQKNPEIISDNSGGAIVVWEDYRDPQGPKVFAQRIDGKGKIAWAKSGVQLSKIAGACEQTGPQIVPDGKAGAIAVWENYEGQYNAKDVLAQRVDGKGALLWKEKGVTVATGGCDQFSPRISPVNLVVCWADNRADGRTSDIYAQRLNLSGKLLWLEDGIPVCEAPDIQRDPQIFDWGKNVFIGWIDKGGGSFDVYGQKLNQQGDPQWVKDGIAICQSARSQQNIRLNRGAGENLVLAWEDFRFGDWNLYLQAVSPDGHLQFMDDGIKIVKEEGTQYSPQVIMVGGKNIIAWEDFRNGVNYSIYLQKIDASGNCLYGEGGILAGGSSQGGRNPALAASSDQKSFIAAWEDLRFGEPSIFAECFRP